jgi:hypothetical protein
MQEQNFDFLDNIDFDAVAKDNEAKIKQMDDEVPEADNDCGDACKI